MLQAVITTARKRLFLMNVLKSYCVHTSVHARVVHGCGMSVTFTESGSVLKDVMSVQMNGTKKMSAITLRATYVITLRATWLRERPGTQSSSAATVATRGP